MEDIPDEEEAAEEVKGVFVEGKRWLDGGYLASNLTAVAEEVVAITTKHLIKFIFLRSGKSRLYVPGCESDGVSLVTGRDDLCVMAWSERCVHPRVFVYQYNNPLEVKTLNGKAMMEYRCLNFSHDKFLLGISGVPDFVVNLWDWQNETLLTSVPTQLEVGELDFCYYHFTKHNGTSFTDRLMDRRTNIGVCRVIFATEKLL